MAVTRIGLLVVGLDSSDSLASLVDRLPERFRARDVELLLCHGSGRHDPAESGPAEAGPQQARRVAGVPVTTVAGTAPFGYGQQLKAGYRLAIDQGFDIVVVLRGDGRHAPEVIERLVEPVESGDVDAVLGSRMLTARVTSPGGPVVKYLANRMLTRHHNAVTGLHISDWHCSYRAYRVKALADIPFERNSDGFDFDTEVILQLHESGKALVEVPVPAGYGDEIGQRNGLRYALDVAGNVTRYRLHKLGLGSGELAFADRAYELKLTEDSSHRMLLSWLADRAPVDVLDVGCSDGRFSSCVRELGHRVVGVDVVAHAGVENRVDVFVEADLNAGLPDVGRTFDVVILADVLEHLVDPLQLLVGVRDQITPASSVLVSVPNFAHWYPRIKVAAGRFGYERRGIFDAGHLRFFTRRSFERLAHDAGFEIRRRDVVGMPLDVFERGGSMSRRLRRFVGSVDRAGVRIWPTMFGYQFLYELEMAA